jgi:hypothetical protein
MLFQVGLTCGAQLELGSSDTRESELEPLGDYINHNGMSCLEVADLIYKPSLGFDSYGNREVFMVGAGRSPQPNRIGDHQGS